MECCWKDGGTMLDFSQKFWNERRKNSIGFYRNVVFTRFFFLRIVLDSRWLVNPHYAKKHYIFSYYEIRSHLAFWYYIFSYYIFFLCVLVSTVWAITTDPTLSIPFAELYKTKRKFCNSYWQTQSTVIIGRNSPVSN